jgi:hypothetical protein
MSRSHSSGFFREAPSTKDSRTHFVNRISRRRKSSFVAGKSPTEMEGFLVAGKIIGHYFERGLFSPLLIGLHLNLS